MNATPLTYALVFLGGYLLGSIPFGYLIGKLGGIENIMEHGSGNIGATNVHRVLGLKYGVMVLVLDALKGIIPSYLGLRLLGIGHLGAFLAGLFAIVGHNWSIFLKLKGGKGVATSAGVLLVSMPLPLLVAAGVFLAAVAATRFVSLGSLLAAWGAFAFALFFADQLWQKWAILLLCLFITYKHRGNIKRLLTGKESRLGQKSNKVGE